MTVYAFISHSTEDLKTAKAIKSGLGPFGIEGFIAHVDITPSQDWQQRIKEELTRSSVFLPLVTKHFQSSYFTDQETGYALALGVPILPISMDVIPYGFIAGIQAIRLGVKEPDGDFIVALIKAMNDKPELGNQIRSAMAEKFVEVKSFNEAKQGFQRLRAIGGFTTDNLNFLLLNASENDQIFNYGGAIGHMRGLLEESAATGTPVAPLLELWNRKTGVA